MIIRSISLRWLKLPLRVPYRLSYRTFTEFEPFYVEITTDTGAVGFGDGHISPGSSAETREGGWQFSQQMAANLIGRRLDDATVSVAAKASESKVAASAFATAIEVTRGISLLDNPQALSMPLLVPVNNTDPAKIPAEIETLMEQGFRTLKIKVGKDVDTDLHRVAVIQKAVAGRATLRLDANRAFNRDQGRRFASALDPEGIELFEQPCPTDDWEGNAEVARASTVPLMLDEPICSIADIERAAGVEGVELCKLKLKRFGSMTGLHEALNAVRAYGMEPVLGDGLGSDITSWMETCVARDTIRNAGEFNGFLKLIDGVLAPRMTFEQGSVILPAGYRPEVDRDALEHSTVKHLQFGQ